MLAFRYRSGSLALGALGQLQAHDVTRSVMLAWTAASSLTEEFLRSLKEGDTYLRLLCAELVVLTLLCTLILLAWLRYGAAISTVFDSRSQSYLLYHCEV